MQVPPLCKKNQKTKTEVPVLQLLLVNKKVVGLFISLVLFNIIKMATFCHYEAFWLETDVISLKEFSLGFYGAHTFLRILYIFLLVVLS